MTINIVLPVVNGEKFSCKDVIVSLLAYESPLSAKQIHLKAKRKYCLDVSYQAVHKSLNELLENKIIEKKGKEYVLSMEWIDSIKKFTEQILSNKNNSTTILQAINNETSNLYFENLASVDRFLLSATEAITGKEKIILCLYWFHAWTPLFFSKEGYEKIVGLAQKAKSYVLIKGETPLDKWCELTCQRCAPNGAYSFRTGIKDLNVADFFVFEDYIFQAFYPKKIVDLADKEFKKIKKIEDLNIDRIFTEIFEKKVGIPVIVNKNSVLAQQLKQKVKSYFKSQ